jgi:hypothetical protein
LILPVLFPIGVFPRINPVPIPRALVLESARPRGYNRSVRITSSTPDGEAPMSRTWLLLGLVLALPALARDDDKSASSERRVFELRTYYTNTGKLDDLNKRFREHTNRIFKKHGMEIIGFWTPQDEKEDKDGNGGKLIYLLAFPSREAAKKSWDAFRNDPEWQKAKAESEKDGVLVK